jgi:hypothetical protein
MKLLLQGGPSKDASQARRRGWTRWRSAADPPNAIADYRHYRYFSEAAFFFFACSSSYLSLYY